jgi:hypothetical protein
VLRAARLRHVEGARIDQTREPRIAEEETKERQAVQPATAEARAEALGVGPVVAPGVLTNLAADLL